MPQGMLINFDHLQCGKCGVTFFIPTGFISSKPRVCCPNGHKNHYATDEEKASAKVMKVRRELIHAIHRAEQAEAKASEGKAA
jgi:uncharacterized Zn finger protein (UPF0148 family)